jgi:serine/threonine protein kinase
MSGSGDPSLDGVSPDKSVDVFSFGLILYEVVVGGSVFPKDSSPNQLTELQTKEFRLEIPLSILRVFRELIESCCSVDPGSRPTFDEIYRQLKYTEFPFFDDVPRKIITDYVSEIRKFGKFLPPSASEAPTEPTEL